MNDTVGLVGAGEYGLALARRLLGAGLRVVLANGRGPASLAPLAERLGPGLRAGTVEEASDPEIVFLAVPFAAVPAAVGGVLNWDGRIVVDTTNPAPSDLLPAGTTASEVIAGHVAGAQLVKGLNALTPEALAADPPGLRRVAFFASDHPPAKREFARLLHRLGLAGFDLGSLALGGALLQPPAGVLSAAELFTRL